MSLCKSLNSSFTVPFNGFRKIFFYAIAVTIAIPKVILRVHISLNSSLTIPYNGFR